MKDIRQAIYSMLIANSGVSSLVGTRVFPVAPPQGDIGPSVVYHRITEIADYNMQSDSGLLLSRFQIDAWADRADLATQLGAAVFDCLSGFRGIQGTIEIQAIFMVSARDDYDSLAKMHRMSRDYEIWYH